ncbi:MAG: GTPase ObgE [Thermodesulfobacteriota bacterium]
MKFIDQATIWVKSGNGGRGCVSFRREKYIPRGGPDGGDGGRGGHVIFEASSQKDTLFRFHMNQHFRAENGRPGTGGNRNGRNGADLVIQIPLGTTVFDPETGGLLADLTEAGQRYVVAEGGLGGRGNARFATPTNRAPRYAQPGLPGCELKVRLELKLLADVGLIGLPNAGKSTLISRLSAARPKIADYPFTTLVPNLGVVAVDEEHSFVMADIPGLIEGASQGAGLGHRFLKHVERCRLLVHLIEVPAVNPADPLAEINKLDRELAAFDPALAQKPQVVAVSKMDLTGANEALEAVRKARPELATLAVSAVTGLGLDELKWTLYRRLTEDQAEEPRGEA